MTIGLVLGKFAPLHHGHQLVMDAASAATDNQIFIIYDSPSVTDIPLPIRARWVRSLYPKAEVIEAWGGPEEVGLSEEIQTLQVAFLKKILQNRPVTHFFNSEAYGEYVAQALRAVNVQVDAARQRHQISATMLREKHALLSDFVSYEVHQDLIRKVVFLGAPGTGKSTITKAAAAKFKTVHMPEYGREYWEANAVERRLTMTQLEAIADIHLQRERALIRAANCTIFVDTDASTTAIFADYYHGRRSQNLEQLANEASSRYDLTFLCLNDFPYPDTEDRSGEANQIEFQRRIVEDLRARKRPYVELSGSQARRLEIIEGVLAHHRLFSNPADWNQIA